MRGLLIDLDGVLYQGNEAIEGAADTLSWVARRSIAHAFVTNTTSLGRRGLVEKLAKLGIETRESEIHTPAVAANRWLAAHAPGPAALFVPQPTRSEFPSVDPLPEDAEAGARSVVIGDLGEGWSYAALNRAFRLLMAHPRPALVALGMTRFWQTAEGLRLDVAPFVKALEHAADVQAVVTGKPAVEFFRSALAGLDCAASDAVMVGDDIVGDVDGAQRAGLKGLLVRTGKFRDADLARGIRPDGVLDSIAELPRWWASQAAH